jgi:hypothetical protein
MLGAVSERIGSTVARQVTANVLSSPSQPAGRAGGPREAASMLTNAVRIVFDQMAVDSTALGGRMTAWRFTLSSAAKLPPDPMGRGWHWGN